MAPEASAVSQHPLFPEDVPRRYADDILRFAELRTRDRESGSDYLSGPNYWKIMEASRRRLKDLIGGYLEGTDCSSEDTALVPLDCDCGFEDVSLVSDAIDQRLEQVILEVDELRSELRMLQTLDRYGTDVHTEQALHMFHPVDRPGAHQLMEEMLTLHRATAVQQEIVSASQDAHRLRAEYRSRGKAYKYYFGRRVDHLVKRAGEYLRIDEDNAEDAVLTAEAAAYSASYPASRPGILRRWRLKGTAMLQEAMLEPEPPPLPAEKTLDTWMREGVSAVRGTGIRLMLSLIEPR